MFHQIISVLQVITFAAVATCEGGSHNPCLKATHGHVMLMLVLILALFHLGKCQ